MSFSGVLLLFFQYSVSCQIFQPMGIGMGIGMGMPMMMPMPMNHLVGNPFDQGMELEYSPITQLVSSVAHLVEMHQKSKEREEEHPHNYGSSHSGHLFPELSNLSPTPLEMRSRHGIHPGTPSDNMRFKLIPYTTQEHPRGMSTSSRVINSIPIENVPPIMWRIGDLIGRNERREKENLYDMTKIKGFPIIKSSDDENVLHDEQVSNQTNRSWTILEIAKKMLGVDEIPTAQEGNAIAQLVEELRKERTNSLTTIEK